MLLNLRIELGGHGGDRSLASGDDQATIERSLDDLIWFERRLSLTEDLGSGLTEGQMTFGLDVCHMHNLQALSHLPVRMSSR